MPWEARRRRNFFSTAGSEKREADTCASGLRLRSPLQSDAVFTVKGNAAVHVTGYLLPDDEEIDSDEFDSSDEDELASPWGFFDADADEEGESDDEEDYDDEVRARVRGEQARSRARTESARTRSHGVLSRVS